MKTRTFARCKKLAAECLEDRRMMAVVWANEFVNNDGPLDPDFDGIFEADEQIARQIVNRAIDDWNAILDTNFDQDNNPDTGADLQLTILAQNLGGTLRGGAIITNEQFSAVAVNNLVPDTGTIILDDNAGGTGWFFDQTPLDDIEFTSIADSFQSSFIDASVAGQAARNDLYRTVLHEIGHTLGARLNGNLSSGNFAAAFSNTLANPFTFAPTGPVVPLQLQDNLLGNLQFVGIDEANIGDGLRVTNDPDGIFLNGDETAVIDELWQYTFQDGTGRTVTFTEAGGGHFYEGPITANTPGADQHPNDLLNSGRTVPAGVAPPIETTRQFISDTAAEFLADAYGYNLLALPSTLDSAHVMLDDITGTLLIQGSVRDDNGDGENDTFNLNLIGSEIEVEVVTPTETFTERVPYNKVSQILINGNDLSFTNDEVRINVDTNIEQPWELLAYVVSSNEDRIEDETSLGDAIPSNALIDLDTDIPGTQVSLRAAIHESNTLAGDRPIYVGRGIYDLTLAGGSDITEGDFDITSDMTIIGAGAGLTIIDGGGATGNNDRLFEVNTSNVEFSLSGVTLTDGISTQGGAIYAGANTALVLTNVAIINNSSTGNGGAIRKQGSGTVEIYNSVVTDNSTTNNGQGGGIYTDNGVLTIANSIVANNQSAAGVDPEHDLFGIPGTSSNPAFISLGNNLFTTIRTILPIEIADEVDNPAMLFVVDTVADGNDANDGATSLREAFVSANAANGSVWLPPWRHRLTRTGDDDLTGDVDLVITGNVELVGVGPGLSIIDAQGLDDRILDVRSGVLDLSRVTLTGGDTTEGVNGLSGGAIWVRPSATLNLTDAAIVGNTAGGNGGGIFNQGTLDITNSVITDNSANASGGLHVANGSTATVQGTILANNSATTGEQDVFQISGSLTSGGYNLRTSGDANVFNQTGDYLGAVDHVVTSVVDTFQHHDDSYAISLREAIDLANRDGVVSEVWLPAWDFVLTRDRETYGTGNTDTDAAFGDLDIWGDSLVIRGVGSSGSSPGTSVAWRAGVTDAIFELIGDYGGAGQSTTPDGVVDGDDYNLLAYQLAFGPVNGVYSADGDDDGVVDLLGGDYSWLAFNFGDTLDIFDVDA